MMKKKRTIQLAAITACLLALVIWCVCGNKALQLNRYTISDEDLPESFDGYRIAHISDLHNAQMGNENTKLLEMLMAADPDIIAITGDLIDSRNTDKEIALNFAKKAVEIAPCYYVTGNHEARISEYAQLKEELITAGVVVLENENRKIRMGESDITLLGIDDPSFETNYLTGDAETVVSDKLRSQQLESDDFVILLSHRPELLETYAENNIDLVLSGHAHGGQIRLPFVGGLVAPNQGLFPRYDGGLYTENDTNMIVSRGIGNSLFPLRFNNRPELILIELQMD